MRRALVGHSGFVGTSLEDQTTFTARFNSKNIEEIGHAPYDLVVCAGAPAVKWHANQHPEADRANLDRLMNCLSRASTKHCVLISTVDVYPVPVGVDETTPIAPDAGHPYGQHRRALERFCRDTFQTTIVRLPALFGPGLKKNAIFDLLNNHRLEFLDPEAVFQLYDLGILWHDIERIREAGLPLVNVATEPLRLGTLAEGIFGRTLPPSSQGQPVRYDFRSVHATRLGGQGGYLYDRATIVARLADFVRSARA